MFRRGLPWACGSDDEGRKSLVVRFAHNSPPGHSKAMPVILTGNACDSWLEADTATALKLQQPWPADHLSVVATGQRQHSAPTRYTTPITTRQSVFTRSA